MRDERSLQECVFFSYCYLGGGPLPRPRPGPAPGPGGAAGPLGDRLTGPRACGLGDARATSFCRLTPLPAEPGFILVGFASGSDFFSILTETEKIVLSSRVFKFYLKKYI